MEAKAVRAELATLVLVAYVRLCEKILQALNLIPASASPSLRRPLVQEMVGGTDAEEIRGVEHLHRKAGALLTLTASKFDSVQEYLTAVE